MIFHRDVFFHRCILRCGTARGSFIHLRTNQGAPPKVHHSLFPSSLHEHTLRCFPTTCMIMTCFSPGLKCFAPFILFLVEARLVLYMILHCHNMQWCLLRLYYIHIYIYTFCVGVPQFNIGVCLYKLSAYESVMICIGVLISPILSGTIWKPRPLLPISLSANINGEYFKFY